MVDRTELPYRKNCEGYFFFENKVLAQDSSRGYVLFPGGGINENEGLGEGILRETFEETGAVIKNLKKIGVIYFDWGKDWAKTKKQKSRYVNFRGEEMNLFTGEIEKFKTPKGDPKDEWQGELLSDIGEIIDLINSNKPFPKEMKEYYSIQLDFLKKQLGCLE